MQQHKLEQNQSLCDFKLDAIFWIINGVLGIAILLGNSFTCAVFLSRSYLRENYMNIYLISLGVADISMAVLVVPGFAAFCSGCIYKLIEHCWFFGGARDIAFPATVLNLLAITYDRHLAVLRPLHYTSTMTKRKVFTILLGVWLTPLVIASVRNIWQHSWSESAVERTESVYNAICSTMFAFLPIPVLLLVNLKIMRAIKSQRRRIHAEMVESLSFTNHRDRGLTEGKLVTFIDNEFSRTSINQQNCTNISRRKRGTMSCVLIVLIFTFAWIPRAFLNICSRLGREDLTSPLLRDLTLFFLFFQSSVNPLIYSFYRNDFRQAARRLTKGLISTFITQWCEKSFIISVSRRCISEFKFDGRTPSVRYKELSYGLACLIIITSDTKNKLPVIV